MEGAAWALGAKKKACKAGTGGFARERPASIRAGGLFPRVRGAGRPRGPKALPAPRAEKTERGGGETGRGGREVLRRRDPDQRVAPPRVERLLHCQRVDQRLARQRRLPNPGRSRRPCAPPSVGEEELQARSTFARNEDIRKADCMERGLHSIVDSRAHDRACLVTLPKMGIKKIKSMHISIAK